MGFDVPALMEEGRYVSLDPTHMVSAFMVEGLPERSRFQKITGGILQMAAKALTRERTRIAICGECTPLLWSQGNAEAALRLEQLWNEIAESSAIHRLCAYPVAFFEGAVGQELQGRVRHEHSNVYFR
jgi:hypothetical protein